MIKIAFDIDGTLISDERYYDLADTPRYDIIDLFRIFEKLGCEMYIWSGGGVDYANHWKEKLGLRANVVIKGSFIPDIAIDDEDVQLGKVNIKV